MEFSKELSSTHSNIDGLCIFELTVHGDSRGWFKENWQREKMIAIGLPDFEPVQNNMSFNALAGTTRGLHAEPWDKLVSVGTGSVYGAWCDLREGSPTYGQVATQTITPGIAVYVPRGVANGFQSLEDNTLYTYLVNDHWSVDAQYENVNLSMIDWPLDITEISEKDKNHPKLEQVAPIKNQKILIIGANGQLGQALRLKFPDAEYATRDELDITSPDLHNAKKWKHYSVIINAAAYTDVDAAEKHYERTWAINAVAVGKIAQIARENGIIFVHVSSDYVFDGSSSCAYAENHPLSPVNVYGQSKAAGDIAAATAPKHYIVRTSWVIGDGPNFIRTMKSLERRGINPSVVDDQVGRLSFTIDIAAGIKHLLEKVPEYGTYNLTNSGDPISWSEIAKEVYEDPSRITSVTTAEYFADKTNIAKRPLNSILDLTKIANSGFSAPDWRSRLAEYLKGI